MPSVFEKLTVTIDLGNDAMRTRKDVAKALRDLAKRIGTSRDTSGRILDENGNSVGRWEIQCDTDNAGFRG